MNCLRLPLLILPLFLLACSGGNLDAPPPPSSVKATVTDQGTTAEFDHAFAIVKKTSIGTSLDVILFKGPPPPDELQKIRRFGNAKVFGAPAPVVKMYFLLAEGGAADEADETTLNGSGITVSGFGRDQPHQDLAGNAAGPYIKSFSGRFAAGETIKAHLFMEATGKDLPAYDITFEVVVDRVIK